MMIVYHLSAYFILIISNDLSEVSINTFVTLSFAAVLELFLQTFDRFFLSRFILMSYFTSTFLQLTLLVLMEGLCLKLRRVTDLYFLKMMVNAVQYRVTVGIVNNRKLITNLRFQLSSCSKLSNNLPNLMQISFHYCITFFSLHFCCQKVMLKKLEQNYIFQFSCCSTFFWACSCGYAVA